MFRLSDPFILFPLALAVRAIWGLVRPAARAPLGRVVLDAVFMTYLVSLMKIVLGFKYLGGLGASFMPLAHINLVPLRTISEVAHPDLAAAAISQVVGNVLLFVPFGVLLPLVAARFRTLRSVLTAGLLLSVAIEVTQLGLLLGHLMNRASDVDDVILNTIGAVLGYAMWAFLSTRASRQGEKARTAIESAS